VGVCGCMYTYVNSCYFRVYYVYIFVCYCLLTHGFVQNIYTILISTLCWKVGKIGDICESKIFVLFVICVVRRVLILERALMGQFRVLYRSWKDRELKSHFPGLESPGIMPRYWKIVEMQIFVVTNFSMISVNDK